jgi:hypothetical protein
MKKHKTKTQRLKKKKMSNPSPQKEEAQLEKQITTIHYSIIIKRRPIKGLFVIKITLRSI